MKRKITLLVLAAIGVFRLDAQLMISQNFNSNSSVTAASWIRLNNSSPVGITSWFMGNPTVFPAYNGADSSYFAANYNNTTGSSGTISNWLITPTVTISNGGVLQFATRTNTAAPQNVSPDRLEVYMSTAGTGSNVGSSATSVGSFSTLLVSVNPSLTTTGYPTSWTVYTATISGVTGTVTGRIGFRYFVTSAGPTGANSSYIGIDAVEYSLPCANPTLSINASATSICSGNLVNLSANGATTYTWANNGATSASIAVSPTATTIYTLNASSIPNCNSTETVAITVTLTPNVSVSDVTTCPGTAATLVASGASSYSWSTGATTASITDTPTMSTTYSVTGYNGGCEDTKFVTVALGASLSIGASASQSVVCSGSSATLMATGAPDYTWMPGNSQLPNVIVTPSATTNYTLVGASGACMGEAFVTINVNPSPTLVVTGSPTLSANNSITICPGSALTLTVSGATTYTWSNTVNFSNIRSIVTPTTTGSYSYSVTGTGANGCAKTAVTTVLVSVCTGIEHIGADKASVSAFPNPFSQELSISGVSGKVEIYDALGRMVLRQAVTERATLHTENFAKGVYILKAFNAEDKLINTSKLIRN